MLTAGELGSFLLLPLQSEEGIQGRVEASRWCPDHVARVTVDMPCLSTGTCHWALGLPGEVRTGLAGEGTTGMLKPSHC